MDIYELREELLEEALEYLEEKFKTQKKFAKMYFEHRLSQGQPIDSYTSFMPAIHTVQEAIDLAKQMEAYIMGTAAK
jgi:hypothetical protein